jgi:serine/threonine-protein kinase
MACGACGSELAPGDGPCPACGHVETLISSGALPVVKSRITPAPGVTLDGRYKLDAKLGEGGFGAVFSATQITTGRRVAVKVLTRLDDPGLIARFKREAELACKLRDAHTVTTYDFGCTPDGTWFLVMELLEGKSLRHLLRERTLPWPRVLQIIIAACGSLAEAHGLGIIHRDLKPDNLFLVGGETLKVLDFGIAKSLADQSRLTTFGQIIGTPGYMAPEQLAQGELDPRTDLYALGVVAYEAITRKLPYPDARSMVELLAAQEEPPPPPSRLLPGLPVEVDRAILRCLERDPARRFASAAELAQALAKIPAAVAVGHEATQLSSSANDYRAVGAVSSPQPVPQPDNTMLVLVIALVVIGGAIGILTALL